MLMFKKKEIIKNVAKDYQEEAKQFQSAVNAVHSTYAMKELNLSKLSSLADKFGIDVSLLQGAFDTYLRTNAIEAVNKAKKSGDYTMASLESTAGLFGFDTDALNINYYSDL